MSTVEFETSTSNADTAEQMATDLVEGLSGAEPKLALAIVPAERDQPAIAKALRDKLPKDTRLAYTTSGAPIGPRGVQPNTAVLASLGGDLEVGLGFVEELTDDAVSAGISVMKMASEDLGVRPGDLDETTTLGIVVDDGMRFKKEELLLGLLDANAGLSLVGGGASDGRMPGEDPIATLGIDGKLANDSAMVILLRTDAKWWTFRHHAYEPTGETLTITKVDDTSLRALEIDGQPAVQRYAELLGVGPDELEFGKPKGFTDKPTAMRVGREYFMRAPWQPMDDGSILYSNLILDDTELELMKLVPLADSLSKFVTEEIPQRVGEPAGALYFNCYGRFMLEQATGIREAVDAAYRSGPPAAGLNAVFELYNGFQINSSLTGVAFGKG
ncbi:MAG TPA: FIST N-terminal domain-containing protein [Sandaracinaceae bacterium LLY-WYZ-13_1]|nr:FIST N-terminal domain-containing protein [Sandaracinaceae bacterium LLY-WYZ-13_1]